MAEPIVEMQRIDLAPFNFADEPTMPDVPLLSGVNLAKLSELSGGTPMFVTRPIGILNGISENNLRYDADLLNTVEQQISDKRPPGRLGHVPENLRNSLVPPTQAQWVGVLRQGDTLYGKAFIFPNTPLHQMVDVLRATGGQLSNSLWGLSQFADNPDGTKRSVGLKLESVDFVPPERAGLQALGGKFSVTAEMETTTMDPNELLGVTWTDMPASTIHDALHKVGKAHAVADLHKAMAGCAECSTLHEMEAKVPTIDETYAALSEADRKHIADAYAREKGLQVTPAAEAQTTLSEMTKMETRLSEMERTNKAQQSILARYERDAFERKVDEKVDTYFDAFHINTVKGEQGIASLKDQLRFRALAEMSGMNGGQTPANIVAACDMAHENIKPLIEMFVASAGGPPAFVGGLIDKAEAAFPGFDSKTGRYTDDAALRARQTVNV